MLTKTKFLAGIAASLALLASNSYAVTQAPTYEAVVEVTSTNASVAVPWWANFAIFTYCGGGGGGGSGFGGASGGGGGGGGPGACWRGMRAPVTAGGTLNVTIGAGGTHGAGVASGTGSAGTHGGDTTISNLANGFVLPAAWGGDNGTGGTSALGGNGGWNATNAASSPTGSIEADSVGTATSNTITIVSGTVFAGLCWGMSGAPGGGPSNTGWFSRTWGTAAQTAGGAANGTDGGGGRGAESCLGTGATVNGSAGSASTSAVPANPAANTANGGPGSGAGATASGNAGDGASGVAYIEFSKD